MGVQGVRRGRHAGSCDETLRDFLRFLRAQSLRKSIRAVRKNCALSCRWFRPIRRALHERRIAESIEAKHREILQLSEPSPPPTRGAACRNCAPRRSTAAPRFHASRLGQGRQAPRATFFERSPGKKPPGLPYPQPRDEPIRFRAEVMEPGESFDQTGFELPRPPQVALADTGQGELFGDDYAQPDSADGEPVFWSASCGQASPDDDFVQADLSACDAQADAPDCSE